MEEDRTEETGKATSEEQDPVVAAAASAEDQAPEKVDLNRIIEGDNEYAAEQLAKSAAAEQSPDEVAEQDEGHPVQGAEDQAGASSADNDDPVVLVVKNRGRKEEIRRSQAENRIQQAAHLQSLYETEAAPVLKVLKSNPVLAQAFADAARGDEQGIKKILKVISGTPAPVAGEATGETSVGAERTVDLKVNPRMLKILRADPKFSGYTDEDLQVLASIPAAERMASDEASQEQQQEQEAQLSGKRAVFFEALGSTDPELHDRVIGHMPLVLKDLKETLAAEGKIDQYYEFVRAVRDPSNKDNSGRSLLANFYHDVKAAISGQPAEKKPDKPPAPSVRPALRTIIGGRLEPGAPSNSTRSALPSLAGKTADERRAMFESLMQ